jgi:hypothetical protein
LTTSSPRRDSAFVNTTTIFVNEPFGGIGVNCASGNLAESDGVFSGVIHVLVGADGSSKVGAHTRGTDSLDDLPTDGVPDATTTFVFNATDTALHSAEVHSFTGNGTLTATATGETRRFHVVLHVLLDADADGNIKVEFERLRC